MKPSLEALAREVVVGIPLPGRLSLAAQLAREGLSDLAALLAEDAAMELRVKAAQQKEAMA